MHSKAPRLVTLLLAITLAVTGGTLIALNVATASAGSASTSPQRSAAQDRVQRFERWATITRIPNGYYYDAGQQDTHLVVTPVKHGLRYTDRHTDVLRTKPDSCDRKPAKVGLVVVCHVPRDTSPRNPLTVKVFTRLGNDYVNTSALPAAFRLYGLCDQGDDTYIGGKGNDFINGAPGRDHVSGGPGKDLVRGGLNHDLVLGGPGNDTVTGLDGPDRVHGASGKDRVGGGTGDDYIYAGPGQDFVVCNTGNDRAFAQREDRVIVSECEHVQYS
ncbi:MAG: calcium-binding protein [Actinomycetes bacterium]